MPVIYNHMNTYYPAVDVIVCAYNNKKLTSQCLNSLLSLSYSNYKIILVDDCSTDDSVEFLKNKYPTITIVKNKKNLGAAKTRSNGIKLSQAKYIVTMDNDATLSPDWLTKMIELMESDEKIGQAGGKILFLDNPKMLAEAGVSMCPNGRCHEIGFKKSAFDKRYNKTRKVLMVSTASTIIRKSVFDYVGRFYDAYYYGYEDSDLSWRINIAGYKVMYYPKAVSYHMLNTTVNKTIGRKKSYYWMRNRLLIMFRNYELKSLIRYLPANLRFTAGDCFHHPERVGPAILGWFWIIFHLLSIIKQRREINSFRKASDNQLSRLFGLN